MENLNSQTIFPPDIINGKTPEEIVQEMYNAFMTGDMEALKNTLSEDTVWVYEGPEDLPYAGVYQGKEGVLNFFAAIDHAVEILDFNVNTMISNEQTVIVLGSEKQKIKTNGQILEQKWVQVYTVENQLITRLEEYANTAAAEKLFKL